MTQKVGGRLQIVAGYAVRCSELVSLYLCVKERMITKKVSETQVFRWSRLLPFQLISSLPKTS